MDQDFGTDFQFKEDKNALQSILNQEGVSYSQLMMNNRPSSITPARNGKTDQLEFFENKSGQVFFRKKVVTQKEHAPMRNPVTMSQKKCGFGRNLSALKPEYQQPRRMNMSSKKPGKFRTPLKSLDVRTAAASTTAKRQTLPYPQIHRQSISERKPVPARSGLPVPSNSSVARKVLFNKPNPLPPPPQRKQNLPPPPQRKQNTILQHKFTKPSAMLAPLTKLTRESFKDIPRESLAWMSQLPRESATFAELEKLMTDDDKKIANEDDTDSFEAMEKRMKTPSRNKLVSNAPRYITENNKENISALARQFESTEFINDAGIREKSQITEAKSPNKCYKKKHEMFGKYPVSSILGIKLSVADVDPQISPNPEPEIPVSTASAASSASSPPVPASAPTTLLTTAAPSISVTTSAPSTPVTTVSPEFLNPENQTPISYETISSLDLVSPLVPGIKCLSTDDLSISTSDAAQQPVQVARSASVSNLAEVVSISDLVSTDKVEGLLDSLNDYEEQLRRYRVEQDELLKQELELINKISRRKQEFKDLWGVSPLRINTKRTILPLKQTNQTDVEQIEKKEDENLDVERDTADTESPRRVRFNSGKNETRNLTPVSSSELPLEGSSSSSLDNSGLFNMSRSNSFNQSFASLKSSFSFLQTPLHPKKRITPEMPEKVDFVVPNPKQLVEPTPIALRKLSDRVKAEFDALYADSDDTDEDVTVPGRLQEKLSF